MINIFVEIYCTNYCSKLLNAFNKNSENALQKNIIHIKSLEKYKEKFSEISDNSENLISDYSLKDIDFYGLKLFYLNIYDNEKILTKFNDLYKSKKMFI